ncbi:MAG: BstXI family restriction endonuclease [Candidatus Paceibacterota bacterium]
MAKKEGLLDYKKLNKARMIDSNNQTTCPLCLELLTGAGFF